MDKPNSNDKPESPLAAQQHEQIAAAAADADVAADRAMVARKTFENVCLQAATALAINPATPAGQTLFGALTSAFQWGAEFADASGHAAARREEVELLTRLVKSQESELHESRNRRAAEHEASESRTEILARIASSQEKHNQLVEGQIALLGKLGDKIDKMPKGIDALPPIPNRTA